MSNPILTAPLAAFQRALAAVTPHLALDDITPSVECVNVVNSGPDVLVAATDRYTAIEYRVADAHVSEPETQSNGHETFLLRPEAIAFIRDYHLDRDFVWDNPSAEWPPTFAPSDWTVSVEIGITVPDLRLDQMQVTISRAASTDASRRFDGLRVNYPAIADLIPDELTDAPTVQLPTMALERLTRTARILNGDRDNGPTPITFHHGQRDERKPVTVISFTDEPVRMITSATFTGSTSIR